MGKSVKVLKGVKELGMEAVVPVEYTQDKSKGSL